MELITSDSSVELVLSIEHVSIQIYLCPLRRACLQLSRIFSQPIFFIASARSPDISWKDTSSGPQTWNNIAYSGTFRCCGSLPTSIGVLKLGVVLLAKTRPS